MSSDTDRIQVPTNGKGPHPVHAPDLDPEPPAPEAISVAFTPTQLAVGFGILASLVLLVVGRMRRRGRTRSRGPFGRDRFGRR
jgi:hypothetical protein